MQKALTLELELLLLLLWTAASAGENPVNARIVGGAPVNIASVPYLINLRINGVFTCGGSLVTPIHVITAAHCVKGVAASKLLVVAGATLLSEMGVRRTVEKVFTPKAYNARTLHTDVAVLKLTSPLSGTNIATIGLCNSSYQAGELIKVSGWGQTTDKSKSVSMHVRSVEVSLIPRKSCTSQYKFRGTVTKTMFCASVPGIKDACDGDSGGPAVYNGQLCGIVSWGIGCAKINSPGVYTSIKTVRAFIDKAMSK